MSSQKRASTATDLYTRHLKGTVFQNNPANTRQDIIERMYFRILFQLAVSRFKWINLPAEINERFLEVTLFRHALSVFFRNNSLDKYFALQGGSQNYLNMYDDPVAFQVVGSAYAGHTVSALKDTDNYGMAIPIWANPSRMPDLDIVMVYSHKFAELDRTVEINSLNARQSKVIMASENARLSMRNINRMIDEGQNYIEVSENFQVNDIPIQVFDMGVDPKSHGELHILKVRLWNECMGLLGINNANQDKKERLVASEVDANNEQTDVMKMVNLNERRHAAKLINAHYKDLNIEVEYSTDFENLRMALQAQALGLTPDENDEDPDDAENGEEK